MIMRKWHFLLALVTTLLVGIGSTVSAHPWWNDRPAGSQFELGLIGDLPYDSKQEAKFTNLINDMNRSSLAFIVHDGDFKSGSTSAIMKLFINVSNCLKLLRLLSFLFLVIMNEPTVTEAIMAATILYKD